MAGRKTRADLLVPLSKDRPVKNDPVRFITSFGTQWQQVRSILSEYWHILTRSDQLKEIVGERPLMVAKRARNIKDELVESEFRHPINRNWLTDMPRVKGMFPCGHCTTCRFVDRTKVFLDSNSSREYTIN